jgi:two-component system chemotaxis response regulator CheY
MKNKKILIVDDIEGVRVSFKMILEHLGEVTLASDGIEAKELIVLACAKDNPFDLVITDKYMEKMGGVDLIKWIKSFLPTTPCILMSTREDDPQHHQADLFVNKLWDITKIQKLVSLILSRK